MADKKTISCIILLALFTSLFFIKILLNPQSMLYSNHSTLIFKEGPYNLYLFGLWRNNGELPLWNPTFYSGHPMDLTISPIYPLKILFYLIPADSVFGFYYAIHILLAGVFTFAYCRKIGLKRYSSIISSLSFMFSGFLIKHTYASLTDLFTAYIWLPAILYCIERVIKDPKFLNMISLGGAIALEVHAGHPQITFNTMYFIIVYLLFRIITIKDKRYVTTKSVLVSSIIGVLLSMNVLLSVYFFSTVFPRTGGVEYWYAVEYSYNPVKILTLIIPEFFGSGLDDSLWDIDVKYTHWEVNMYVGLIPLILAIYAIFYRRCKFVLFYSAAFIVFFIAAAGVYLPLYKLIYHLPGFNMFRAPHRLLQFSVFSLSVLAGFGADFALKKGSFRKRVRLNTLLLFFVILTVVFLSYTILEFKQDNPVFDKKLLFSAQSVFSPERLPWMRDGIKYFTLVSIISLVILSVKNLGEKKIVLGLLVILVFLDLSLVGGKYIDVLEPDKIYPDNPVIDYLVKDDSKFRVMGDWTTLPLNMVIRNKLEKVNGYGHLQYNDYKKYLDHLSGRKKDFPYWTLVQVTPKEPKLLNLLNVKYYISEEDALDNHELIESFQTLVYYHGRITEERRNISIYFNKDFLPRAYFVPNAVVEENRSRIFARLTSDSFNERGEVILEKMPEIGLKNLGAYREVPLRRWSPNKIVIEDDFPSDGFLVLSEVWYPGWKALIDGNEEEILRGNYLFRVIPIRKGLRKIVFEFKPYYFYFGLKITLITLMIITIYLMRKFKKFY